MAGQPFTSPWAPPEGRLQDAFRIADMIRDTGRIQAQGQYNKRLAVADLVSGVSGTAIGMIEANQEKRKQAEIASILQSGETFDPYDLVKKYGVESTKRAYDLYASMRPKDDTHVLNQGDVLVKNGKVIARGDPKEEPAGSMQWALAPGETKPKLYPNREINEKGYDRVDPNASMRDTEGVTTAVDGLKEMSAKLITESGVKQRAGATVDAIEAWFGSNPEYRAYTDLTDGAAMMLATEQQGRPSDADVRGWRKMIPDPIRDTAESAKIKWDYIHKMRAKHITPAEVTGSTSSGEPTVLMQDDSGRPPFQVPVSRVGEVEKKGARRVGAAPAAEAAPTAAPAPVVRPQTAAPPLFTGAPGFTPPSMTGLPVTPPGAPPVGPMPNVTVPQLGGFSNTPLPMPAPPPGRQPVAPPTATGNPLKGAPAPAASGPRVAMLDPGGNPITVAQSQVAWAVANGASRAPVTTTPEPKIIVPPIVPRPPATATPPGVVLPNPGATTPVDPRRPSVRREEARGPLPSSARDRPSSVMVRMIDNDGQERLIPPENVAAAEALDWKRVDSLPPEARRVLERTPAAPPATAGTLIGPPVPEKFKAGGATAPRTPPTTYPSSDTIPPLHQEGQDFYYDPKRPPTSPADVKSSGREYDKIFMRDRAGRVHAVPANEANMKNARAAGYKTLPVSVRSADGYTAVKFPNGDIKLVTGTGYAEALDAGAMPVERPQEGS